jgi:hypothetical protein
MARVEIPFVIQNTTGDAINGAQVTIRKRSDNSLATLYVAETGGSTLGNPVSTTTAGRVDGWVDEDAYNLAVTGPGLTPYTQAWNAVATPGGTFTIGADTITSTELRDDASVDANRAVTTNHVRDGAIVTVKLANNAVDGTKLSSSASVDTSRAVSTDHIKDNAVTQAKLASAVMALFGNLKASYAAVAAAESTSSTSFTNLATVGPQVTVTVPSNGLVAVYAQLESQQVGGYMQYAGLEEPTDLAGTQNMLQNTVTSYTKIQTCPGDIFGADGSNPLVGSFLLFPATAGTRTYTMKYKVQFGGSNASFRNRKLWVATFGP